MGEDVNELQKEWRAIVLDKLNRQETNLTELRKDIAELKIVSAQATEVKALREEVDKLKEFRARFVGIIIAVNAVIAVAGWIVSLYFTHVAH